MRPIIAVSCLAVLLVAGCGQPPSSTDPSSTGGSKPPARGGAPDTARIVCDRDGTRVLTPEVEARPDEVHFVVENRTKADVGYSVELPDGAGMGDNAPKGVSRHAQEIPPGEIRIGCNGPGEGNSVGEPDYRPLKVLRGDSGFKPVELECPGGQTVAGMGYSPSGPGGTGGAPVEQTRRALDGRLREGDVVEAAGYPEGRSYKVVRVVRGGRVVATVGYFPESGGWAQDVVTTCEGF